jgi:hypothetical protein
MGVEGENPPTKRINCPRIKGVSSVHQMVIGSAGNRSRMDFNKSLHRNACGSLLFIMKFRLSVFASAIIAGMNVAGLRSARKDAFDPLGTVLQNVPNC